MNIFLFSPRETARKSLYCMAVLFIILTLGHSTLSSADTRSFDEKTPFRPGEKLTYQAKWGKIPAGEVILEILPLEKINGREAYHFAMITKTNGIVDLFYKIRERQDSYVDINMTHSILYKKQNKGKHPRDVVVNFNWEKFEATRSNFGEIRPPVSIGPDTFDPLALFYILRLQDMGVKSIFNIPITEGDKNIMVKATVTQREVIEIDGQKYDTFKIIPDMGNLESANVVSKSLDPELIIWLTDDNKKIPVKIETKAGIGYFTFEIASINE